ncbi:hypothetical protein OSG_eHP14_00220 [environmental Halophage eHP-14]|nr:hypothetical protein OSG_eHP14_00220 [environmental Halophage eHP-14]
MTYKQTHPIDDQGDGTAGTSGAAELDTELRTTIEVFYNVSASTDDIIIEGSTDASTWRELPSTIASGSVTTGGDTKQFTTAYQHVRVYAGSSFSDGDVTTIELVAKGD